MRRLLLLVLLLCLPAAPAGAAGFGAGAAVSDVTPPLAGPTTDPPAFATCPALVYSGKRVWAFDEPYTDLNANDSHDDGEPYCDANLNARYDRIWTSGAEIGDPLPALRAHDPLTARAFAVQSGGRTVVVVSVAAQGLFNTYIDRMITKARAATPTITDMVVAADHNESSPDTIGIYGGPVVPNPVQNLPAASGIDDYYMSFLVDRVSQAAGDAARNVRPATLHAAQVGLPANVSVDLSDNWPTTDGGEDKPAAIDPRVSVLQARDGAGTPIFTVMSLAAHNQEIGHGTVGAQDLSSDWPGFFAARVAASGGGTGIFVAGANGSEEDPVSIPAGGVEGSYARSQATGEALADAAVAAAHAAAPVTSGAIALRRTDFCVPLENNVFRLAAAAGLFGDRQTYLVQGGTCVPAAKAPDGLLTTVGLLDIGPDLQFLLNPGEAFPALLLGSPFGIEDVPAECRGRANPPVANWLSHARFRFQLGLADDFIGYELPPWAFIGESGTIVATADPACQTTSGSTDSAGHKHKLETEGVGPTASGLVATNAAQLERDAGADPLAQVKAGRFVQADGSLTRKPAGARGILLADGTRYTDATATFLDYNGVPQAAADLTTRGMITHGADGCPTARIYLDVFPATTLTPVAPVTAAAVPPPACVSATPTPVSTCPSGSCPVPTITPAPTCPPFGFPTALCPDIVPSPGPTATATPTGGRCIDSRRPHLRIKHRRLRARRLRLRGIATDKGCFGAPDRVEVIVLRGGGTRIVVGVRANGRWRIRATLPHRPRRVRLYAVDPFQNRSRPRQLRFKRA
ncbi:MAG: hypothetical protein QOF76_1450 [Solirubrobacteraceae bacterium]|nr:hypothetical protein [Solirubrobacteraceae bacterium]